MSKKRRVLSFNCTSACPSRAISNSRTYGVLYLFRKEQSAQRFQRVNHTVVAVDRQMPVVPGVDHLLPDVPEQPDRTEQMVGVDMLQTARQCRPPKCLPVPAALKCAFRRRRRRACIPFCFDGEAGMVAFVTMASPFPERSVLFSCVPILFFCTFFPA